MATVSLLFLKYLNTFYLNAKKRNEYRELCNIVITISTNKISPLVCYFEEVFYARYYVFEPKHYFFFLNLDSKM